MFAFFEDYVFATVVADDAQHVFFHLRVEIFGNILPLPLLLEFFPPFYNAPLYFSQNRDDSFAGKNIKCNNTQGKRKKTDCFV